MVEGMIGKKLGMTQVFATDGTVTPVTVIEAGPCVVLQLRTPERDGYAAVQLGWVDPRAARHATKADKGHHAKAGVPPTRHRREFALLPDASVKPGDPISVGIFDGVGKVDVIGTSKGKGFQGVMRRHNFRGGRASHGSMFHRAPGSIGSSSFPSRVFKGMRAPGHMGSDRITAKNLDVVRIVAERNLLLVRGSVPGAVGSMVLIRKSKQAKA